jgi:hypothetical protein
MAAWLEGEIRKKMIQMAKTVLGMKESSLVGTGQTLILVVFCMITPKEVEC